MNDETVHQWKLKDGRTVPHKVYNDPMEQNLEILGRKRTTLNVVAADIQLWSSG